MKENEEYLDKLLKAVSETEEEKTETEASAGAEGPAAYEPPEESAKEDISAAEEHKLEEEAVPEPSDNDKNSKVNESDGKEQPVKANSSDLAEEPFIQEISEDELSEFLDDFKEVEDLHVHKQEINHAHENENSNENGKIAHFFKKIIGKILKKSSPPNQDGALSDETDKDSTEGKEADTLQASSNKEKKTNKKSKIKKAKKKENKNKKDKKKPKKKNERRNKEKIIDVEDTKKLPAKGVALLFVMCFSLLAFILLATYLISYKNSLNLAKSYFNNQEYEKAYECFSELNLKAEDEKLFQQADAIMTIEKQYLSYENFMKMKKYDEALFSLAKGTLRYDEEKKNPDNKEITEQLDAVYAEIEQALQDTFKISAGEVREWASIDNNALYIQNINTTLQQAGLLLIQ